MVGGARPRRGAIPTEGLAPGVGGGLRRLNGDGVGSSGALHLATRYPNGALDPLDDRGDSHSASHAQGDQAATQRTALEFVDERAKQH